MCFNIDKMTLLLLSLHTKARVLLWHETSDLWDIAGSGLWRGLCWHNSAFSLTLTTNTLLLSVGRLLTGRTAPHESFRFGDYEMAPDKVIRVFTACTSSLNALWERTVTAKHITDHNMRQSYETINITLYEGSHYVLGFICALLVKLKTCFQPSTKAAEGEIDLCLYQ